MSFSKELESGFCQCHICLINIRSILLNITNNQYESVSNASKIRYRSTSCFTVSIYIHSCDIYVIKCHKNNRPLKCCCTRASACRGCICTKTMFLYFLLCLLNIWIFEYVPFSFNHDCISETLVFSLFVYPILSILKLLPFSNGR